MSKRGYPPPSRQSKPLAHASARSEGPPQNATAASWVGNGAGQAEATHPRAPRPPSRTPRGRRRGQPRLVVENRLGDRHGHARRLHLEGDLAPFFRLACPAIRSQIGLCRAKTGSVPQKRRTGSNPRPRAWDVDLCPLRPRGEAVMSSFALGPRTVSEPAAIGGNCQPD
jgi:hypothetical protein